MKRLARGCLVLLTLAGCASSAGPGSRHVDSARGATAPATATAPNGWTPKILDGGAPAYLPDFSYAGYREGEALLPHAPVTHSLRDFGAFPDDGKDDTEAFRAALAALAKLEQPVVLSLERGHYVLSDVLFVERSDFVLRGAGSGSAGSVLEFRRPLAELPRAPQIQELEQYLRKNDKRALGQPFSPFSWTGGLIWTRLPAPVPPARGSAVLEGQRGQHWLRTSGSTAVPGTLVELRWFNRFGSDSPVLAHLFGLSGPLPGERLADPSPVLTSQLLTVLRAEQDTLWLKEPLRHDVRPAWGAQLGAAPARLRNVGFEHFRVQLPNEAYAGHHLERGYNAFYLSELRDGFARDIAIENADSAILTDDSERITLSGIRVSGRPGHYGIHLGNVDGALVLDFSIEAHQEHSLSFNTGSRGSVFSRGRIVAPRLDQHRGRNHQNLFDDIVGIDSGPTSALFEHGGADYWGPAHGAFNTFWNIRLQLEQPPPPETPLVLAGVTDAGPARLVGLIANAKLQVDYPGAYLEGIGTPGISVPSLYDEQLRRRLAH